jgi:hypothetical protein
MRRSNISNAMCGNRLVEQLAKAFDQLVLGRRSHPARTAHSSTARCAAVARDSDSRPSGSSLLIPATMLREDGVARKVSR